MLTSAIENKEPEGAVRLNLTVSREVSDAIDEIASRKNTTKRDVLRKAVALLAVVEEAKSRNERIGLFNKDRQLTTEIVGI